MFLVTQWESPCVSLAGPALRLNLGQMRRHGRSKQRPYPEESRTSSKKRPPGGRGGRYKIHVAQARERRSTALRTSLCHTAT